MSLQKRCNNVSDDDIAMFVTCLQGYVQEHLAITERLRSYSTLWNIFNAFTTIVLKMAVQESVKLFLQHIDAAFSGHSMPLFNNYDLNISPTSAVFDNFKTRIKSENTILLLESKDISRTHISELFDSSSAKETNEVNELKKKRKPIPLRRKIHTAATVEIMIVVDKYMVMFHGNESVQDYILTMMNMVADMYKDPSLGVSINIVVTKVLVLHENLKNLHISHNGDKTLFSFCEWQFLQSLSNGNRHGNSILSYDLALLLTRKDVCAHSDRPCGTIGLGYIGGTCTTNRKCAVVEDIGLNTAYTIAHELGHNLGMTHDSLDNNCKMESGGYPHMMASQWPSNNHVPLKWSMCSKKKLAAFLSSYKSYCIREQKGEDSKYFSLSKALPGTLYDADTQCRQQYGSVAKHCMYFKTTGLPTRLCKQLWCEVEGEVECVSKLDPPAKGTKCDTGKWCMYGKCVNNTSIPDAVDGGWSPWVNWTSCSRSCGVGVKYTERFCNNPLPKNGGLYCTGKNRLYETCNIQPCPQNSQDIRSLQCRAYNNKTIKYMPVSSESQPCALHCRPTNRSIHYSVKFRAKVIDGTPCRQSYSGICIDGSCEKLGCDLQLNSKIQKDICGLCGGNGETCNLVEGEFTQPLGRGYVNAVDIPEGARNVLVKEVKPCASFLALKSGHGTFYVNGNWTIGLPGEYNVNGTVVHYRRRGTQESFMTEGPTTEKMYFMVLFQDFNFGVKYQYVLPKSSNETTSADDVRRLKYKGSFGWMQGPWGPCSVECGGGIKRRRKAQCLHMYQNNISIVQDSFCSGAKLPPSPEETCNEHECRIVHIMVKRRCNNVMMKLLQCHYDAPARWFVKPWSGCSKTCGLGRRKREVTCKAEHPDGIWEVRPPSKCAVFAKPVSIQTCVEKACYLSWRTLQWSQCRASCGKVGIKSRRVMCPLPNLCLESLKPIDTRRCRSPKCEYKWMPRKWGKCSEACGDGQQTRIVECRDANSMVLAPQKCAWKNIPNTIRLCKHKQECLPATKKTLRTSSKEVIRPIKKMNDKVLLPKSGVSIDLRVPRSKRKPRPQSAPTRFNINKLSAPVMNVDNCKIDQLPSWECEIWIVIAGYANRPFCENSKNRLSCCKTCRTHSKRKLFKRKTPLLRKRTFT